MGFDIKETIEYKEKGFNLVTCPVCKNETLDNHYVCPHCNWEYDGIEDEYTPSSVNCRLTVNEYREVFAVE